MKTAFIVALLFVAPALAQTQQPSPQQIQNMINQAQQQGQAAGGGQRITVNSEMIMAAMGMHACINERIGEKGMQKVADSAKRLQETVKPLCNAGKRDEAMARQKAYAKSMMGSPEYTGIKFCADKFKNSFQGPQFDEVRAVLAQPDQTDKHICDYQQQ
jgi:hypothetical protein